MLGTTETACECALSAEGLARRLALEGDLLSVARIKPVSEEGQWFNRLGSHAFVESPEYFSVRRDLDMDILDAGKVVFMRPGEAVFDGFCQELVRRFSQDVQRASMST